MPSETTRKLAKGLGDQIGFSQDTAGGWLPEKRLELNQRAVEPADPTCIQELEAANCWDTKLGALLVNRV